MALYWLCPGCGYWHKINRFRAWLLQTFNGWKAELRDFPGENRKDFKLAEAAA